MTARPRKVSGTRDDRVPGTFSAGPRRDSTAALTDAGNLQPVAAADGQRTKGLPRRRVVDREPTVVQGANHGAQRRGEFALKPNLLRLQGTSLSQLV